MQNGKNDVIGAIDESLRSELFSHVFFETGVLSEEQPRFRHSVLPHAERVFDISSPTKALVTTALVFEQLRTQKLRSLSEPISAWLGDQTPRQFSANLKKIWIDSLLKHESGLFFWANFFTECQANASTYRQDLVDALNCAAERRANFGKSVYSDLNFLLLGLCLEARAQKPLDEIFADFYPHQSDDFSFSKKISQKLAVSTGYSQLRGRDIKGEIHDDNAFYIGKPVGHTGLFASGEGLSEYLRFLWKSETGKLLVSENAKLIVSTPNDRLMGWRQGSDASTEVFEGGHTMGHHGFTGTSFWVEPVSGHYAFVLTNRVKFSFAPTKSWQQFRRTVFSSAHKILLNHG